MRILIALALLADTHSWAAQLNLEQAWTVTRGDGVTVGVVDTGVNTDRPELAGAVLAGAEFPELGTGTRDDRGHGTEVAALVVGVAPAAKILPVKLNGNNTEANAAIRWAVDHGARVLNLSLGSSATGTFDESLRYAAERDVVVVAAAGNAGTDRGVTAPANGPGVLAVSAVDGDGRFAPDVSVEGQEVALAAPGVKVTPAGGSGTSFAAALVSGAAALVRASHPDLTAPEVVDLLTSTAKDAGPPGRDPRYGNGIVDPARAVTAPVPASWPSLLWWSVALAGALGCAVLFIWKKKVLGDKNDTKHRPNGRRAGPRRGRGHGGRRAGVRTHHPSVP